MTQDVGQAPDDGQTESGAAASLARRIVELMELLEDPPALLLRDADPGIPDLDAQLAVAAPAPEQDAPFRRIADRVGQQVAENALEQMRIAVDHLAGRHHAQGEAALARLRPVDAGHTVQRSEEHTSELQSLMRNSYAVL